MRMKKKIIIVVSIILVIILAIPVVVYPIWITAGDNIICTEEKGEDYIEYFEIWKKDPNMTVYLDAFSGEYPSKKIEDYRALDLEFKVTNTSFLKLKNLCVTLKCINCDNKKNVISSNMCTYDEGGFDGYRFARKQYKTPFMFVYVGDLTSEKEIEERMEDIAGHAVFQVAYSVGWFGTRYMEWSPQNQIKGYIIEDGYTAEQKKIK